jgi:hypothetical protein
VSSEYKHKIKVFEVRARYDSRFHWPLESLGFECCVTKLRDMLKGVSLQALDLLCKNAKLDFDVSKEFDDEQCDLSECSNSALRILLYSKPEKDGWFYIDFFVFFILFS